MTPQELKARNDAIEEARRIVHRRRRELVAIGVRSLETLDELADMEDAINALKGESK